MVGLLNLIPLILATMGLFWVYSGYKKKDNFLKNVIFRVMVTVLVVLLYTSFQPTYMPKGEVKRSVVPDFNYVEKEVRDVVPKPVPPEERDARRKEQYKETLPFLEKEIDTKK